MSRRRWATWCGSLVLVGYAVGLAALLLWPTGVDIRRVNLDIYLFGLNTLGFPHWVTPQWYAAVANVLVPLPLSASLTLLDPCRRWLLWGGVVGGACVLAEVVQGVYLPGRDPQVSDALLNAAGAFIGAALLRRRRV